MIRPDGSWWDYGTPSAPHIPPLKFTQTRKFIERPSVGTIVAHWWTQPRGWWIGRITKVLSKGKGKKRKRLTRHSDTPDGRPICFKYNNPDEKCEGGCNRVHCCQFCFGRHPQYNCTSGGPSVEEAPRLLAIEAPEKEGGEAPR